MDIMQITGLAIVGTVLALMLKAQRPELSMLISIMTGIVIFGFVLTYIGGIYSALEQLFERVNIDNKFFIIILKVIGIAYIAEFAASACRDAGQSGIAAKVELAAKIIIFSLSLPIMLSLINLLISLIP